MKTILVAFMLLFSSLMAQQRPAGIIGEVISIETNRASIKTDKGETLNVTIDSETKYLRIAPGEKTLNNAKPIATTDIRPGDRVFAQLKATKDPASTAAQKLIVISKAELEEKHQKDAAEWRKRGVFGIVTSVNPQAQEITLRLPSFMGENRTMVVEAPGNVSFRRYSHQSIKYSDSKESSFTEIKVGDQLRALGTKNADNSRMVAEAIVSGSFKVVAGRISNVDSQNKLLQIEDVESRRPLQIALQSDTTIKNLPEEIVSAFIQRQRGNRDQEAAVPSQPRQPRPASDIQESLERLPASSLEQLKPGDQVIVSSMGNPDAQKLTAITILSGVDPILRLVRAPAGRNNQGITLTGAGLDFGMGIPQ
jgi:hypothetical protein